MVVIPLAVVLAIPGCVGFAVGVSVWRTDRIGRLGLWSSALVVGCAAALLKWMPQSLLGADQPHPAPLAASLLCYVIGGTAGAWTARAHEAVKRVTGDQSAVVLGCVAAGVAACLWVLLR